MKTDALYTSVTNRIIAQLKEGVPPWSRPWKNQAKGAAWLPSNAVTGRAYSGINVLILYMTVCEMGYPTHGWATFKQANDIGAKVRKGEKASQVVFVKHVEKEDDEGKPKKSTILKAYPVFNIAQLDNVPDEYLAPEPPKDEDVVHDNALQLMNQCGIKIVHGGNKAAYYPNRDEIVLPTYGSFESEEAYFGVANHELIHATSHESRLKRKLGKRFEKHAYSQEELIAELGSAFLCARLGIPATFRSASYIAHWLEVLEKDSRAIFTAASYASQAADWLWEKSFHEEGAHTPDVERAA